ncbi:hypothetical protein KQX54_001807 [Cotesia glomerata]|uniref:Uncharacterized protein n=1 Tax=Cotesia glomerata TaxID=32391 RepID=A0AAV7J2Q3_COTGL|nr:hypothetical protein KQX54_001807 [Cotesia glomerata]
MHPFGLNQNGAIVIEEPIEVSAGIQRMDRLVELQDIVNVNIRKASERQAQYYNPRRRVLKFTVGDTVYRPNKVLSKKSEQVVASWMVMTGVHRWSVALKSGGGLRSKASALKRGCFENFAQKKELPSGCAFCGIEGHAARFCKNSAQKKLPFCTECNVFVEGGRCIGDHGDFRSLVRGRCMICHKPRTSQHGQCTQCGRSVLQQLRDCPHAMDIIEENVTAAHSQEKLGLPDWG